MAFHGKCENLSLDGALVSNISLFDVEVGNEILIAIPLPRKNSSIKVKSTIRWIEKDKFGIRFYKRKNPRKIYKRRITVFTDAMICSTMINNLSRGGANIQIDEKFILKKESEIHAIIPFANRNEELTKRSVVKWVRNGQCGIQFV